MDGQLYIAAMTRTHHFCRGWRRIVDTNRDLLNSPIAGDDSGSNDLGAPNFDGSVTNLPLVWLRQRGGDDKGRYQDLD